MKEKKNTVWWFGDRITSQISGAEVQELKDTAREGYQTIEMFSSGGIGITQIVSADWVIVIEES